MIHARKDYDRIQDPANKIAEDEPVFLLRAKDQLAPGILMKWATELINRGGDKKMAVNCLTCSVWWLTDGNMGMCAQPITHRS